MTAFIQNWNKTKEEESPSFEDLKKLITSHPEYQAHMLASLKVKVKYPNKNSSDVKKTLQISCQYINKFKKLCQNPSSTVGEYPRFAITTNGEYKYICAGCAKAAGGKEKIPIEELLIDDSKFGESSFLDNRPGFPEPITEDLLIETKKKHDEKEKKKEEAKAKKAAAKEKSDGSKSDETQDSKSEVEKSEVEKSEVEMTDTKSDEKTDKKPADKTEKKQTKADKTDKKPAKEDESENDSEDFKHKTLPPNKKTK